jgi:hypothetical protein
MPNSAASVRWEGANATDAAIASATSDEIDPTRRRRLAS